ncbi:hypothetical protein [Corynebacterium cystitidis]|uniref:hypothetical protein n=1 Tax=Corynebacterium cystitidis TaxID=35757 RepID=UPI00211ECD55|nr:hypothetical protein [Corynebacterium cystitidis]
MEIRAIVRLVIYVIGALAGLAAAVLASLGVVDHIAPLTAIAGAAATITGGTAAFNIEKGRNQPVNIGELIAAFRSVATEIGELKERPARTDGVEVNVTRDVQELQPPAGQHRADDGFSIYQGGK